MIDLIIEILIIIIKITFILGFVLNLAALLMWAERKQSAVMQDRIGANRADIFGIRILGLFHIISDAIKMITKEDFTPDGANKFLHIISPILVLFPSLFVFAIVPFGGTLKIAGREIGLQVVDLNIGILFLFAILAFSIYGVVLAGWSSNNKYSLLGGIRACAQMISYEVVLGLSIIGILIVYESLSLSQIVSSQGKYIFGFIPMWGIIYQPLGFLLFLVAAIAVSERIPFDLPEGESEIIGYYLEYSGMRWGIFMMADFVKTVLVATLIITLFFGGYQIPYLTGCGIYIPNIINISLPNFVVVALQVGAFIVKVSFFCFFLLLVRWTLPRFRYDQLMNLGWKIMIPLALLNIFITGVLILLGV